MSSSPFQLPISEMSPNHICQNPEFVSRCHLFHHSFLCVCICFCTGKCICNWVCFCILYMCPVTVLRRLWCWRTGIQGLDCFPCTFWGMNGSSIIVGYCEVKPRLVWIFRPGPGLIQYCTFRLQHGYEGYVFSRLQGKNILLNMPDQTHYVF